MPPKSKNRFTLKLLSGYVVLGSLVVLGALFIYSEFSSYLDAQHKETGDDKLLQTNQLLTALYEAENLSKLALQDRKKRTFLSYAKKVDSIHMILEGLKVMIQKDIQIKKLDSVQGLLQQKVYNNAELRKLKQRENDQAPIDSILIALGRLEMDLGRITPEQLVPNFYQLPLATQNSIKDYVVILNRNIPRNTSEVTDGSDVDSILNFSISILHNAKKEHSKIERSMLHKELQIHKNDLELSQKLREIIASIEQDIFQDTQNENFGRQRMLRRSTQLAWIVGLLGLLTIVLFTFLTANDYWKGQLYRERLEKEKRFSESLLKSREQLISTVSHDLRSPLNTIKGYTDLLQRESENPLQLGYFKQLKSASEYVENLTNDLLDFSKLEAGKVEIENKPFIPGKLLKELVQGFKDLGSSKNLPLLLQLDESTSQPLLGDSFRIRQIVTNLIANALKFTHKGHVNIKAYLATEKGKRYLKIEVIDTGIGISKDQLDSIFMEFVQADPDQPDKHSGYGLGLTISQKLAFLMGGTLTVESEINKGSIFTLKLPWKPSHKKFKPNKKSLEFQNGETVRLVVIDDDVTLLSLISEICKIHKIKCHTFSSFKAFSIAPPVDYTHILTDIEMPEHDGFSIVKTLKNGSMDSYSGQPIIAMTGRRNLDHQQFEEAGFSKILRKPFSNHQLLEVLFQFSNFNFQNFGAHIKEQASSKDLFCTNRINSFVDDTKALHEVLTSFLEGTHENLKQLNNASIKKDFKSIENIAHKMLPMFHQLEIYSIIPILEALEQAESRYSEAELKEVITALKTGFLLVIKQMQAYLVTLSAGIA
ncbi:ATP-binding protein [Flagellimonas algicola]|uniref:histidine kinase n=1 Tax=Flagellimonas algicola TaxID=2583815 RepID=A0ABY2WKN7_9FLAO|nr:ATP-binding protein [Allomuricauda algicola]TMU55403.1 response regulator [Allomuricauda algicola]